MSSFRIFGSIIQGRAQPNDYEYSGDLLVDTAIAFIVLNSIFLALRCYARLITKAKLGVDDYLIFVGFISNIGLSIASILIVFHGGVGRHLEEVKQHEPALIVGWAKGIYAIELIYLTSVALPKLAALCFYARIFVSRVDRVLAYSTMCLITINWAAFMIAAINQCKPVAFWWDRTIKGGSCFNVQAFYRAMCVPNIATDLIVLALPIAFIFKLKLSLFKKLALSVVFLTASVGLIASIFRFAIFFSTDAFEDNTWASVALVGWSVVESGMYLIAACLPLLRPVFIKHSPGWLSKMFATTVRSRHDSPGTYQLEQSNKTTTLRSGFTKLNSAHDTSRPNFDLEADQDFHGFANAEAITTKTNGGGAQNGIAVTREVILVVHK